MIHAYDEYYLGMAKDKLGCMFEIATYQERLNIDDFAQKFVSSPISKAIERADPIFLAGKSPNELLSLVLGKKVEEQDQNQFASPEYWVGYVLAYTQWYTNKSFSEIISTFPSSELLSNYFPYHEMDILQTVKLITNRFSKESPLKVWRHKRNLSQKELAEISGVSLRSIKAYEQRKLDLSKAEGETLYKLAKTLSCSMEELMK